ncbi:MULTISPECIES: acyl-CoA dehydrogenase family protein [Streptomyces]|uniref:acyl-CoA dehydrogenase family protein n=1 Tax=Streptomyces TaxID=1883 RepID=UPI001E4568E2|nr:MULTISPECIES: acyl-CoA dehydrogenase family protein [Streptomyces]UFQ17177.1 acyl-CoA/acyl-ACP dehydrogenase [Streptomyces huasconensis]WCL86777.1 acyl-CoA/acyl-ACP dehydrogenase [Streptomyces sp. JCM 35825]
MTLPDDFDEILDRAHEVGRKIAALAADVDDRAGDPRGPYRLLAEAGFLSLLVPRRAGGAGLGFADYWRVLSVIGFHNGAAALGLNMHNAVIGPLCETADHPLPPPAEEFRAWLFAEVAEGGRMFASAASEPASGAKLRGLRTRYRRQTDGTGFVITGRKSFVSLAGIADYYAVPARPEESEDPGRVSHLLVARDDPGVTFGEVHHLTAMYGTSTADMALDSVAVPASRLVLGIEGLSLTKVIREPHWMVAGYTGAYLGIAEAVRQAVVDHATASPARARSATVQRDLGLLTARLHATRALVERAGEAVDRERGGTTANTLVHAAKYAVADLGHEAARIAVSVCGSAAVSRSRPIERLLRELQYGAVMPAKPEECLEYLGKAALGVDLRDEEAFSW